MRLKRLIIKKSRKFIIQRLKNDLSMIFHSYNLSKKKYSEIESICLKFSRNTDLAKKNEKLHLKLDSQIVPKILEKGTYDDFLFYFLKRKLKKKALFIDVGSNHGLISKMISKNLYIQKIIAYEPAKSVYELSKLNLYKIKNILIHNYGWSKKNENKMFYENPINSGDFSLIPNKQRNIKHKFKFKSGNLELKKILNQNKNLAIILKTDCQGYDFEIFDSIDKNILRKIYIYTLECSNNLNNLKKKKFINKLKTFKKIFIFCPLIHLDTRRIKPNDLFRYFEYKVEFELILVN